MKEQKEPGTKTPGWPKDHMLEAAWGLLANVDDGNGMGAGGVERSRQTEEWRAAAGEWREAYHELLKEEPLVDEELERLRLSEFRNQVTLIVGKLRSEVPPGELEQLVALARRVETSAMARVVRWIRDTSLSAARLEEPGLAAWDRIDRDLLSLLRQLEKP